VRMTARCTHILAGLLIASCFCLADSGSGNELTVAEYYTELDQLLIAAQQLDSSGRSIPPILKDLPPSWRVRMEQQDFEISAESLRQDVRKFTQEGDFSAANAIRSRIKRLRDDLDGFETSPQDVSTIREHLTAILARREFRDVRGQTFFDRLAQRLLAIILSLLGLLFRSSAIPTISKVLVYGLIGLAVLMLGYLAYRQIKSSSEQENVVPLEVPVSAKSWELWLADARAAAEQDNWRDAVHLAYWAAISFLEHQGTWRPDRARTPREYLRLMSASSEHRETLAVLTQIFELTWYAKRKTDAGTFAQTMQSLERLGCHPS
jgi:hypothetical protein